MQDKHTHTYRVAIQFLALLLFSVLLSSCGTGKIVSSWSGAEIKAMSFDNILVIGVARNATTRRLFENSFVEDLQREGKNAFVSYKIETMKDNPTTDTIIQAVKETGADAVLLTRLNGAEEKTLTQESVGRTYMDLDSAPLDTVYFLPEQSTSTYTRVRVLLESRLYDVETKQLIWSATSRLKNPVMTKKYMEKATDIFIKDLKEKKWL